MTVNLRSNFKQRDLKARVLTVFQGAQELGRAPRAVPRGGEAQHWGVVGGELLQVGDAATVNTVEIRSDGDHSHTLWSIHWPRQELGNSNMDELSLEVVSIWNQSGFGCQNHLNLIAKNRAMLLNYCQLWCWTDGCSTVILEGCLYHSQLMGIHQHCNSPWLLLNNARIMGNYYSDDTSLLSHQPGRSLLLKASWRKKSTFSATLT